MYVVQLLAIRKSQFAGVYSFSTREEYKQIQTLLRGSSFRVFEMDESEQAIKWSETTNPVSSATFIIEKISQERGTNTVSQEKPNDSLNSDNWTCPNGHVNESKTRFCIECGAKNPALESPSTKKGWICSNGHHNDDGTKFCIECGEKRADIPNPPKHNESKRDMSPWTCSNGHHNEGGTKFCMECGQKRENAEASSPAPIPAIDSDTWSCSNGHINKSSNFFCDVCGQKRGANSASPAINPCSELPVPNEDAADSFSPPTDDQLTSRQLDSSDQPVPEAEQPNRKENTHYEEFLQNTDSGHSESGTDKKENLQESSQAILDMPTPANEIAPHQVAPNDPQAVPTQMAEPSVSEKEEPAANDPTNQAISENSIEFTIAPDHPLESIANVLLSQDVVEVVITLKTGQQIYVLLQDAYVLNNNYSRNGIYSAKEKNSAVINNNMPEHMFTRIPASTFSISHKVMLINNAYKNANAPIVAPNNRFIYAIRISEIESIQSL